MTGPLHRTWVMAMAMVIVLPLLSAAHSDEGTAVLRDGQKLEGPLRWTEAGVVIEGPTGRRSIPLEQIARLRIDSGAARAVPEPPDEVLKEWQAELGEAEKKSDRLWRLAKHCRKRGQAELEFRTLRRLLALDPYHVEGLKAARAHTDALPRDLALRLPVAGRWRVCPDPSGHHQIKAFAVYAFDLVAMGPDGQACRGRGAKLEDHYAYGQPVQAAADGEVIAVVDEHPDNPVGQISDPEAINYVYVRHAPGRNAFYAHVQKGSAKVKVGEGVHAGQVIARAGNSGASGSPHLHFAITDDDRLSLPFDFVDYEVIHAQGRTLQGRTFIERGRPPLGTEFEGRSPTKDPRAALRQAAAFLAGRELPTGGFRHYQSEKTVDSPGIAALILCALTGQAQGASEAETALRERTRAYLERIRPKLDSGGLDLGLLSYRNYTLALLLSALVRSGAEPAATATLAGDLARGQLAEAEGCPSYDWRHGAFNYYWPHASEEIRADLSVTAFALEALRASGRGPDDIVMQRARRFLSRCQNRLGGKATPALDGGFYTIPRGSKAGHETIEGLGRVYRPYGSATCDGLRALLAAGTGRDDPAVQAALGWLARNTPSDPHDPIDRLDENPGFPANDPLAWSQGMLYYYHLARARALRAAGLEALEGQAPWAPPLCEWLLGRQGRDGSWRNDNPLMGEDQPELATALAMLTMQELLPATEEGEK